MMLNKCIIQWFWVDVTTKALYVPSIAFVQLEDVQLINYCIIQQKLFTIWFNYKKKKSRTNQEWLAKNN